MFTAHPGLDPVPGRELILSALACLVLISACSYRAPAPIDERSSTMVKRQLDSDGSYYVRKGDTLYAISFAYGLDAMDVAKWNGISSPYTIYPGQKISLKAPPATNRHKASSSGVQISVLEAPGKTTTRSVGSSSRSSGEKSTTKNSKATTVAGSTTDPVTTGKPPLSNQSDPKSWLWPTKGRVHRTFVAGDPSRNGLDIAGKEGQAVKASSGGYVVYSGQGLIGYGELIIIKHSENMLSAYAHNKVRLVNEGDQVSAGQKIAEMGRNTSDEQLLHFEIRSRGKPVNPLNYLPKN
jgi:lipoprotein NlpD